MHMHRNFNKDHILLSAFIIFFFRESTNRVCLFVAFQTSFCLRHVSSYTNPFIVIHITPIPDEMLNWLSWGKFTGFGVIWIRIGDPRSVLVMCIKGTGESMARVDLWFLHHDLDRSWIADPNPDHPKGTNAPL